MHCITSLGQWAVQFLQGAAFLRGASGQRNSCNALPRYLTAVGSATLAMHDLSVWGGSAQWDFFNALPPYRGGAVQQLLPPVSEAVHRKTSTAHRPQAVRQCNAGVAFPTTPT